MSWFYEKGNDRRVRTDSWHKNVWRNELRHKLKKRNNSLYLTTVPTSMQSNHVVVGVQISDLPLFVKPNYKPMRQKQTFDVFKLNTLICIHFQFNTHMNVY